MNKWERDYIQWHKQQRLESTLHKLAIKFANNTPKYRPDTLQVSDKAIKGQVNG